MGIEMFKGCFGREIHVLPTTPSRKHTSLCWISENVQTDIKSHCIDGGNLKFISAKMKGPEEGNPVVGPPNCIKRSKRGFVRQITVTACLTAAAASSEFINLINLGRGRCTVGESNAYKQRPSAELDCA